MLKYLTLILRIEPYSQELPSYLYQTLSQLPQNSTSHRLFPLPDMSTWPPNSNPAYSPPISPSLSSSISLTDPPMLPPFLERPVLNSKPISTELEELPSPNHSVMNHLMACSIKDNTMAVAVSWKYQQKIITTILFKPVFPSQS